MDRHWQPRPQLQHRQPLLQPTTIDGYDGDDVAMMPLLLPQPIQMNSRDGHEMDSVSVHDWPTDFQPFDVVDGGDDDDDGAAADWKSFHSLCNIDY